jgi:arylformamidase
VRLIDVSVPIRPGMVVWEGDPPVSFAPASSLEAGDPANVTTLALGSHSGTHVDAPLHFLAGGSGVDELPLEALVGPALVLDLVSVEGDVRAGDLHFPDDVERLLLKTANSRLWGRDEFVAGHVAIAPDAARLLVDRGVRLVGIDYLSVGSPETHRILLGAGVVALESLDLRRVDPGAYQLVALPLPLVGVDGAPARVLLIEDQ